MADVLDYVDGTPSKGISCSEKIAAELALLREMPTNGAEQIQYRLQTASQRPEEIARDVGLGMIAGSTLGAVSHNSELSRIATACMLTPMALDLLRRIGVPMKEVWSSNSESTLSSARTQMGRDLGDMVFDYSIGAISGGIGHDVARTRLNFALVKPLQWAAVDGIGGSFSIDNNVLLMSNKGEFPWIAVPPAIRFTGKVHTSPSDSATAAVGDFSLSRWDPNSLLQNPDALERVRHLVHVRAETSVGKKWLDVDIFDSGLKDLVSAMNIAHLETKTPALREVLESAGGQYIKWNRTARSYSFQKPLSPPESFKWRFPTQFSALNYKGASEERPQIGTLHAYPQMGDTWFKLVTEPKVGNRIPGVIAPKICNGDAWFDADISAVLRDKDLSFKSKKGAIKKARNLAYDLAQIDNPTFKAEKRDDKWLYVLHTNKR